MDKKEKRSDIKILDLGFEGPAGIRFISEAGFDSEFFNHAAWDSLLASTAANPDINVVLVDGAISRLDRPEFLNRLLTYWDITSEEKIKKITEDIPNHKQCQVIIETQLKILRQRLRELKKKAPKAKIILSIHSDSLHFSFTEMMNELLLVKQQNISVEINKVNDKIKKNKYICRDIKAKMKKYKGPKQKTKAFANLKQKLINHELFITNDKEIRDQMVIEQQKFFRVKKIRPYHQFLTNQMSKMIVEAFRNLCKDLKIFCVEEPTLVFAGDTSFYYAHSFYNTWGVRSRRKEELAKSFHGQLKGLNEYVKSLRGGSGLDMVVESHHGSGYYRVQRLDYDPAEINFNDVATLLSRVEGEYVEFVILPTFEDQRKIAAFVRPSRIERMGPSGKPLNSRNNPAVDRYKNGGVTGIFDHFQTEIGKGKRFIKYDLFLGGKVAGISGNAGFIVSADEHIKNATEDLAARRGLAILYSKLSKDGILIGGQPVFTRGYVNAGDLGEANSENWRYRPEHKKSPLDVLDDSIDMVTSLPTSDVDRLAELAMNISDLSLLGKGENMDDVFDEVADYLMSFFQIGMEASELKYLVTAVTGNHIEKSLGRHGLKEMNYFVQRLKEKGVKVFEAGRSKENNDNDDKSMRASVGGYEIAHQICLEAYGKAVKGKPVFGPFKMSVAHDPKGSKGKGLVSLAKNTSADLAIAGHTHEIYCELVKTGENDWVVAFRAGTMMKATPTEMKITSIPRTSGAHFLIMDTPGDFTEITFSPVLLRRIFLEQLKKIIEDKLKQNMKK